MTGLDISIGGGTCSILLSCCWCFVSQVLVDSFSQGSIRPEQHGIRGYDDKEKG